MVMWYEIQGKSVTDKKFSNYLHRYALKELNLLGEDMHYVPLEEIGIMRNLRSVGLSKVRNYGSVTPSQAS